jgi:hypothetical protein
VLKSSTVGGVECSGRAGTCGGRACYRGQGVSVELANVRRRGALGEAPVVVVVAVWWSHPRLTVGGPGPSH